MITCPVCEHAQAAGSACEVCGRHLVDGRGSDAPVAPLEGLEPTGQGAGAAAPREEPLPGLEPTRLDGGGEAAAEAVPGLEATATAPVEVSPDVMPDLEPTFAPPIDDGPTPAPAVVICRYCRTEAAPGERRCGRCGMRLPVLAASAAGPAGGPAAPALCSCGTPVTRSRCPACGARTAAP
jgi:hypothetical protein